MLWYKTMLVCAISNGFLLVSFVPNWVSPEEVCLTSFEVLICLLDDENELPLKVLALCSAWHFLCHQFLLLFPTALWYAVNSIYKHK